MKKCVSAPILFSCLTGTQGWACFLLLGTAIHTTKFFLNIREFFYGADIPEIFTSPNFKY